MAYAYKLLAILLVSLLASSAMISARKLNPRYTTFPKRLKLNEPGSSSSSCWDALLELQSCSGEVVLFFLNGETQLGSSCCNAIRTIEQQCWPSMLGSLGITTEESDILRGYCDAAARAGTPPSALHFPRLLP